MEGAGSDAKSAGNVAIMDKHDNDHAITRKSLHGTTPEPTYGGVTSFMRRRYSKDLEGADVAVLGVPFDTATTNRPGARLGPRAIRSASTIMAWERPYGMEFDPFDKLAVVDAGDAHFDFGRPEKVPDEIEAAAYKIISGGPALLTLGGDHTTMRCFCPLALSCTRSSSMTIPPKTCAIPITRPDGCSAGARQPTKWVRWNSWYSPVSRAA